MDVPIRYVYKEGNVIELFLGIKHVANTNTLSLKKAVETLFCKLGLSISRLRGQGYDGTSNIQGELNGFKTLILKVNPSTYYVHCIAHQLQLALVAVAKNHDQIALLLYLVSSVVNVVGVSCKRRDILRDKQVEKVVTALNVGKLSTGQGLNQETSLKRSGDTRWDSHYNTLLSLMNMFSAVIDVLEIIAEDGSNSEQRAEENILLNSMQSFGFIFNHHLMRQVLAITFELSQALQRKDQDIVNAMNLVEVSKKRLQMMRESGWISLLDDFSSFCEKNEIDVFNMDDDFVAQGQKRHKAQQMTNLHYFRVELFYVVIDMQFQELNVCFTKANSELLLCVACLNPSNSFFDFDKKMLIRLAEYYPNDFSPIKLMVLHDQLDTYIFDMRSNDDFSHLNRITHLVKQMVKTGRDKVYPSVYFLITLALILPVATATVERVFSVMNIVKNQLRNRMGDQWMNDSLVAYIERDVFI